MTRGPEPVNTIAAYDGAAEQWDQGLGFRSPQFAARLRAVIVRLLQPARRGLALELGAGTGWMLDATAPLFDELHAIEASAGMLRVCQQRIASSGVRNVRAYQGDAMTLEEVGDARVDAIYAVGLLDAVAEPQRMLAACHRVLKPGGMLVLATANGDCPWHRLRDRVAGKADVRTGRYLTSRELVQLAGEKGLVPVEVRTWGAAPQQLSWGPAVAMFSMIERVTAALGLSRYLSVLTASFRKPA